MEKIRNLLSIKHKTLCADQTDSKKHCGKYKVSMYTGSTHVKALEISLKDTCKSKKRNAKKCYPHGHHRKRKLQHILHDVLAACFQKNSKHHAQYERQKQ